MVSKVIPGASYGDDASKPSSTAKFKLSGMSANKDLPCRSRLIGRQPLITLFVFHEGLPTLFSNEPTEIFQVIFQVFFSDFSGFSGQDLCLIRYKN
jgi:hypothetical protein